MRDIRRDLEDRFHIFEQQISVENAWFEQLILQLTAEHDNKLEHLRAQLRLANKLLEFMDWRHNVCATLAARIAVAELAEAAISRTVGSLPTLACACQQLGGINRLICRSDREVVEAGHSPKGSIGSHN